MTREICSWCGEFIRDIEERSCGHCGGPRPIFVASLAEAWIETYV